MSKKYVMTASRYINGRFIKASPDVPVVIEMADDVHPGPDMREVNDSDAQTLGVHYATRGGHPQSDALMKPFDATEKRASGSSDHIEYREEGKRVEDQVPGKTTPFTADVPLHYSGPLPIIENPAKSRTATTATTTGTEDKPDNTPTKHRASDKKAF